MAKEMTLTEEGFALLLDWLDADSDVAARKYEAIRNRLIRVFIGRGCYEPELLADLTIDRVSSKISGLEKDYVGEPAAYFYGVANNIHHEWIRRQKREIPVEEVPELSSTNNEDDGREDEFRCLETCLSRLGADVREMILEYYRDEKRAKIERRRLLAERLGITAGALQIKTSRIRAQLHACVTDCLGVC